MIYGNIILIAVPAVLAALGALCAAKEQKALFSLLSGAAVFLEAGLCRILDTGGTGYEMQQLELLGMLTDGMSTDVLFGINAPPAYLLILKICMESGAGTSGFVLVQAILQAFLAAAYIYNRPGKPYAGAVIFAACFLPCSFVGGNTFTAMLICLFSAKYIEERRFFRAAAILLAAACFDISAVLLIPLWLITLIPNNWAALLISGALAASAALLPEVTGAVYEFLGEGMYTACHNDSVMAVFAGIAALILIMMTAMFRHSNERTARLIPAAVCGAALSAAAVFVPELFMVSETMLSVSLTALAPDANAIIGRFAEIMLPDAGKKASIAASIALTLILTGVCAYKVICGNFGTDYFSAVLFRAGI